MKKRIRKGNESVKVGKKPMNMIEITADNMVCSIELAIITYVYLYSDKDGKHYVNCDGLCFEYSMHSKALSAYRQIKVAKEATDWKR